MSEGLTPTQTQHAAWVKVKFPNQELSDILELISANVLLLRKARNERERGLINEEVYRIMTKDIIGNMVLHLMSSCDVHGWCFENITLETWRLLKRYSPTSRVNIL